MHIEEEELIANRVYPSSIPTGLSGLSGVGQLCIEKELSAGWRKYILMKPAGKVLFSVRKPAKYWNPNKEQPPPPIVIIEGENGQDAAQLAFTLGDNSGLLTKVMFFFVNLKILNVRCPFIDYIL